MHLHDYMGWSGPVTHRQHSAWLAWDMLEWNRPDKHDYYLMQIAQTNAGGHLDKYKLEWGRVVVPLSPQEKQAQEAQMNEWLKGVVKARLSVAGPRPPGKGKS